jgi:hypothetical protein
MSHSPHEQFARAKKVTRLADCLWLHMTDAERRDPDLPDRLRAMNAAWRDSLAQNAGVKTPSPETWAALCDRMATLIEAERCRAERRTHVA